MNNQTVNSCSHCSLIKGLQQALPALERMVSMIREFNNHQKSKSTKTCDGCTHRNECKEPCDVITSQLPGVYEGNSSKEISINLDNFGFAENEASGINSSPNIPSCFDRGRNVSRITSTDIFAQYERCFDIFSIKQREVLEKHFRYGKKIIEIAQDLKKSPSTVSGLLSRAKEEKEKYEAKLRKQKFELLKKAKAM